MKERLIAAARTVLARSGLEAATVKEIAREAGANPGLVHYYFGGKDSLMLAMVERSAAAYAAEFEAIVSGHHDGSLAAAALSAGADILRRDPDRARLQAELLALGLRRPDLHAGVAALVTESTARTATIVAAVHGRSKPNAADELTAAVLRSAFDGLAMQLAYDPSFDLEAAVHLLGRLIDPPHDGAARDPA